ncbi:MAG: type III-B CRISPR module RAMP protein Cmr4 [Nitrospinae bacterium]|nr:type III-B CRISPR module RAMP protein Cmr4 [Nitrospinota bacterium]MBF0633510.1 type III-B CRISPR module RAMP protein Cmr4 [Nitrospinota bacterium]
MEFTLKGGLIMPEYGALFIHAMTGLHPGSGTALGVVDLPIQRERHTLWPVIPGSSLKGVLRDACRGTNGAQDDDQELCEVFGPLSNSADKHAGALSLTDARILAFPVRSLRGVFAWVTCPGVIERLNRDMGLGGMGGVKLPRNVNANEALCPANSPLLVGTGQVVLEEFEFKVNGDSGAIAEWIAKTVDDDTKESVKKRLLVLDNDDFTHFVRHATEVSARIGLDYKSKTAKSGALFYQEFIPPETIFYSLVIAENSRVKGGKNKGADIMGYVENKLPKVLQIGGDETIGKGICKVWIDRKGGAR